MTLKKNTQHVAQAKDNLLEQCKKRRRLEALLAAFVQQVQELENALFELLEHTYLSVAAGAQLDGFGSLVGERREGRTDEDFRLAIRARLLLNLSRGTSEDIIGLVRGFVGAKQVQIVEDFSQAPAHFDVFIRDPVDVNGFQVAKFMRSGKPAGVRGVLHWFSTGAFRFDTGPGFDKGKLGGGLD